MNELEKRLYHSFNLLVPVEYKQLDVNGAIRARFFVATILFSILSTVIVLALWLLIHRGQIEGFHWLIALFSLLLQFSCLGLFYLTGRRQITGAALIWSHYIFVVFLIVISGGIESPFIVMLIVMPVLCWFINGATQSKALLLLSVALIAVVENFDVMSIHRAFQIDQQQLQNLRMIFILVSLILIVGIFVSYEITLKVLKEALVDEKNRFLEVAEYDSLTGLLSFKSFSNILDVVINRRQNFAIFYIDIDEFKTFNQQYDHKLGDRLLQQLAARISNSIRNDDVLSRLGSDDFIVLINGISVKSDVEMIKDNLRQCILPKIHIRDDLQLSVSCRVGCALSNDYKDLSGESLIEVARQDLA